jgi:hypothetical protein
MNRELFLKDGWFTLLGSFSCFFFGLAIIGLVLWFEPQKIISLIGLVSGTVLIGLAGYEARARALKLQPPFTSDPLGWRKAKESYKTQEDSEDQETKDK